MKNTILIFIILTIFIGCTEVTLQEQREDCIAENKTFTTKKVMNFRTGEYEIRGECK